MSDSNATLKFGGGFEYPWLTPHGETPDEIKAWIRRADEIGLVEDIIEFSLKIRYMMHAAEQIGYRPSTEYVDRPEDLEPPKSVRSTPNTEQPKKKAAKGGLVAQAKAAAEAAEPDQVTDDVESLIANAMSTDELNEIYEKHDGENWPAELTKAAWDRAEELSNG